MSQNGGCHCCRAAGLRLLLLPCGNLGLHELLWLLLLLLLRLFCHAADPIHQHTVSGLQDGSRRHLLLQRRQLCLQPAQTSHSVHIHQVPCTVCSCHVQLQEAPAHPHLACLSSSSAHAKSLQEYAAAAAALSKRKHSYSL
jgi:hypothetical protein